MVGRSIRLIVGGIHRSRWNFLRRGVWMDIGEVDGGEGMDFGVD